MSGEKYAVVGVMPQGFQFPNRQSEFWIPLGLTPDLLARRNSHFLQVIGRIEPTHTIQQAQKELDNIASDLATEFPATNKQVGITAVPLQHQFLADGRNTFVILLCSASCVLLIACANVANLLLARSSSRQREVAVRTALGASSGRMFRQILTENLLLSLSGGAFGLLIAGWVRAGLSAMIPADLVGIVDLNLDWRTIIFTTSVSAMTGLLFGLAPAVRLSHAGVSEMLKGNARGNLGQSGGRLRDALVVGEIAVALILAISASLLIESLVRLHSVDAGFRPEGILTAKINAPLPKYQDSTRRQGFYNQILDQVRAIPGVTSAGLTSDLPYTSRGNTMGFSIEGRPFANNTGVDVLFRMVSSGYLETIGSRLVEGRLLRLSDGMDTEPVVVVNKTLAEFYWPNQSALGQRIDTGTGDGKPKWMTIVGVVQDIRERGVDMASKGAVYVPFNQTTISFFMPSEIAVRASREPLSLSKELQQAVWSIDAEQPVTEIETLNSIIDGEFSSRTQVLTLLGTFAGLALLLAAFGIYSVLSYVVSLRASEIGLRMAVGASRSDIAKSMLFYSAKLGVTGILFGVAGAAGTTRLLSALLYGVSAGDVLTFATVSAGLLAVALLSSWVPVVRATRIDPMTAIRSD
jgi:predicted permease